MTDLKTVMTCENNLLCHCANLIKTSFAHFFYSDTNKNSHDCNHAVISDLSDSESALEMVEAFYYTKAVTPRIFFGGFENERELLTPALRKRGWTIEVADRKLMLWGGGSLKEYTSPKLQIIRKERFDDEIYNMFFAHDGGDWCALATRDCMNYGSIDVFVGRENSCGAASVSIEHDNITHLALVQDVFTLPQFRGKGYARAMMSAAMRFQLEHYNNKDIYLWVENPVAMRVYEDIGFVYSDWNVDTWFAFKQ
ncbi:MAG TPA: GNAT family N-acetyltransferase [Oscillospiraceae bacterium]|nr:GNAT family N-acetyltransferase [Oscillospiraceae bacterium]HPF56122.1 GNAT family N-acetyltransferase [Clostridiales bacterium]HPK35692.1 GNAT family N-acetyltransferase [Oscillospiraceae bacterium]HPR76397.1 GNAT family N-acetyltransferase [Oscillospiraceae bacterium]